MIREFSNSAGELSAVITRNSYGCLVLNTSDTMFVDIDLPEPKRPGGFLRKLFGTPDRTPKVDQQAAALTRIENWTRNHSGWGWRIYRTRAGLRLLATHDVIKADVAALREIFEPLGADPLYLKLCQAQKCFRARLTPKPWRCGLRRKPNHWPRPDAKAEKQFEKWEADYRFKSNGWATCKFLRPIGSSSIHPEIQTIITLHDETTRAASKLELA